MLYTASNLLSQLLKVTGSGLGPSCITTTTLSLVVFYCIEHIIAEHHNSQTLQTATHKFDTTHIASHDVSCSMSCKMTKVRLHCTDAQEVMAALNVTLGTHATDSQNQSESCQIMSNHNVLCFDQQIVDTRRAFAAT